MRIITILWSVLVLSLSMVRGQEANTPTPSLVPPEKMSQAVEMLQKQGTALPAGQVVAIGFEPGTAEHTSVAVITLDQGMNPVKTVITVTPDFYASLLGTMSPAAAAPIPPASTAADRAAQDKAAKAKRETGRIYFIISTAARTLGVYPAGFATLLGNNADYRTVVGLSLLTFGGSLYGSYRFTKDRELGYGRVAMMNYGGELGISYSILVSQFTRGLQVFPDTIRANTWQTFKPGNITGHDTTTYDTFTNAKIGKIVAAGAMIGFPLGIYAGSRLNLVGNYQYGNADIMRFFGRSGLLYGYLLPMYSSGGDRYKYLLAASGLSMGLIPGGFYLGRRLVEGKDYSSGRGFMIETSGIMGGLTGLLVPQLFNVWFDSTGERRIMVTSILAGHALGTLLGFKYKPANSYNFFQGVFTAFSAGCGAALGLSIPFLAQADSSKPYIAAGVLGAWGGFFAGEYLAKSLFEITGHDQKQTKVDISLPIAAQWPVLLQKPRAGAGGQPEPVRVDIVQANVTF